MFRFTRLFFWGLMLHQATAIAQIVGGERTFEFLRLPASPHVTALGGFVVSNPSADLMLSTGNVALLRPEFHTTLGVNYNIYYAGTRVSNMMYAHHSKKLATTFGLGVQYVNYGKFTFTDDLGNIYGSGSATDYALRFSASRKYLEKWRYGATITYASSRLYDRFAASMLADLGIAYADTQAKWYVGATLKNAGVQLRKYKKTDGSQPLPLDLQIGITKKFNKAPFTISVLGHHLYTWDIRYDNPADRVSNQLLFGDSSSNTKEKKYFADKLFRHMVFALDVNLGKRIEVSAGYNHLRRSELSIIERRALSGFSFGAGIYLNKFTIHYAQSYYHLAGAYNEIGINLHLNQLFGLGATGKKINWSEKFAREY